MRSSAEVLVALFPLISFPAKYMDTSLATPWEAIIMELMMLSLPSERTSHIGIWDPVITTGFPKPSSMKERAEAVYAMVSVP